MLLAAALPEYKVILEAYHPSRKYTDPYLFCTYLGTDGLSSKHEGEGSLYQDCEGASGRLAKLGSVYSRFRPEHPSVEGSMPARRIAGATLVQASNGTPSQPIYANSGDGGAKKIVHTVNLDPEELFGQFCAYASLVRLGPRRGVFLSTVQIVKGGTGVIRVWREWLQERARETADAKDQDQQHPEGMTSSCLDIWEDKNILWTDYKRNVGLKVRIKDMQRRFTALSAPMEDDLPLSFAVEIQGMLRLTLSVQAMS